MHSFSCALYLWIYSLEIINYSECAVCYEMEKLKVHSPAAPEFELNSTFIFAINYVINVFWTELGPIVYGRTTKNTCLHFRRKLVFKSK